MGHLLLRLCIYKWLVFIFFISIQLSVLDCSWDGVLLLWRLWKMFQEWSHAKKILRKLSELRNFLPQHLHCFVDILDSVNEVYTISLETVVNKQHKVITSMFEQRWLVAMANFGISMPLKVHIICHHLSDYFQLTGQTLRRVNDQVVEASHHKVKQFFENRPNYNHKNKETEASGEATLRGIIHFNAFSIIPSN